MSATHLESTAIGFASAPGKIMLAGEYAVLEGGRALAVTIDGEMIVSCEVLPDEETPNGTTILELHSNLWFEPKIIVINHETTQTDLDPFTDAAIKSLETWQNPPAKVIFRVRSDLDPSFGAGSSSALRLTVLAAAKHVANGSLVSVPDLEEEALALQRKHQPAASGYDLAVQSRGGLVEFRNGAVKSLSVRSEEKLEKLASIVSVMIGGKGAPTGATMTPFLEWLSKTGKFPQLIDLSEATVDAWEEFLVAPGNLGMPALIETVAAHRKLLAEAPGFPEHIAARLSQIPGVDKNWTWKTTGAGGEDAILLIGPRINLDRPRHAMAALGWKPLPFSFTQQGLMTW